MLSFLSRSSGVDAVRSHACNELKPRCWCILVVPTAAHNVSPPTCSPDCPGPHHSRLLLTGPTFMSTLPFPVPVPLATALTATAMPWGQLPSKVTTHHSAGPITSALRDQQLLGASIVHCTSCMVTTVVGGQRYCAPHYCSSHAQEHSLSLFPKGRSCTLRLLLSPQQLGPQPQLCNQGLSLCPPALQQRRPAHPQLYAQLVGREKLLLSRRGGAAGGGAGVIKQQRREQK